MKFYLVQAGKIVTEINVTFSLSQSDRPVQQGPEWGGKEKKE